jgi:ubiquinone/menaquinone biosynthesis C-methylase UbiE
MTNTYIQPADYWNKRALSEHSTMEPCGALQWSLVALMAHYMGAGDSFLEVGSGDGRIYDYTARHLSEVAIRYHACDISAEYAKLCEERTGLAVDVYDGVTLPYDDDSYDWVISFSVLLHVPPADIERHVAELVRVARRYVFVSTYTGTSEGLAPHCFAHHYYELFYRLRVVEYRHFVNEDNTQWLIAAG